MTIPRVIIGRRSASDPTPGIYVSSPGINAESAPESSLVLNVSTKINQLIMQGFVTGNATIPLGLSRSPFVFLTSRYNMAADYGYEFLVGPIRPSPYTTLIMVPNGGGGFDFYPAPPSATATINSNGSSMTISTTVRTDYVVFRNAFT